MRPGSLFAKPAPAAPKGWMASPSSSTRTAQLSWNSSAAFYKQPSGKDMLQKNGAWLMESGYLRRIIPLEWATQSVSSMSEASFSSKLSAGDWHHLSSRTSTSTHQSRRLVSQGSLIARGMLKWSGIRLWLQSVRRKNSMSHGLSWPMPMGLCLKTVSCLHEVLPHPWHLNTVLWECLHAFHHYQLNSRLTSIGSWHHDRLHCLTSAVCYVELILRGTTDNTSAKETRSGGALTPSRAFMDNVSTLV